MNLKRIYNLNDEAIRIFRQKRVRKRDGAREKNEILEEKKDFEQTQGKVRCEIIGTP